MYLVHWRAPDWCLEATASILGSENVRARCHVIDNGATGGDDLAAALDPRAELISVPENLGYTGAANLALERAMSASPRPEFIVVAAHDVLVQPDTLAALADAARGDRKIGILGPILTAPAVEAGGWWRGWRAKATSSWDDSERFNERDWVSGTLLFMRPECIGEIGGFDVALGSYVEDVDLCLRARDAGWRVGVAPAARASGQGSASADVTLFVDINSVLVAVKRRGLLAAPPILGRYAYWAVRGVAAAAVPGRTSARRRASLAHARDHTRALGHLAHDWKRVRRIARAPRGGVPGFDVGSR